MGPEIGTGVVGENQENERIDIKGINMKEGVINPCSCTRGNTRTREEIENYTNTSLSYIG